MDIITGSEQRGKDPRIDALVEFYGGFNGRDLGAVADNWASQDSISMSNPLGGLKRGREDIESVYRRLFGGSARVYVEFHDFEIIDLADAFVAVGRERGFCERHGVRIGLHIRTSRVFRMIGDSWKQVHHHGSIEDPDLLNAYQQMLLGPNHVANESGASK